MVSMLTFETSFGQSLVRGKALGQEDEAIQTFSFDGNTTQLIGLWSTHNTTIRSLGALILDLEMAAARPFESTLKLGHVTT